MHQSCVRDPSTWATNDVVHKKPWSIPWKSDHIPLLQCHQSHYNVLKAFEKSFKMQACRQLLPPLLKSVVNSWHRLALSQIWRRFKNAIWFCEIKSGREVANLFGRSFATILYTTQHRRSDESHVVTLTPIFGDQGQVYDSMLWMCSIVQKITKWSSWRSRCMRPSVIIGFQKWDHQVRVPFHMALWGG